MYICKYMEIYKLNRVVMTIYLSIYLSICLPVYLFIYMIYIYFKCLVVELIFFDNYK